MGRRATELTETKNGTARTVHLNADVVAATVSARRTGQKPAGKLFPRLGSEGRFDTRSWFVPCLAAAKASGHLWHGNRHTFCSWLAMAGAPIKEIQELAGHKTITLSARHAHLSPDHKLSVIDRITTSAAKTAIKPARKTVNATGKTNSHRAEPAIAEDRLIIG